MDFLSELDAVLQIELFWILLDIDFIFFYIPIYVVADFLPSISSLSQYICGHVQFINQ